MFRYLKYITLNTIIFNFKYFPFKTAIKFPVFCSRNVILKSLKGHVFIDNVKIGVIKIGYGDINIFDKRRSKSIWEVKGIVNFRGKADIGHGMKISVWESGQLDIGDGFILTAESAIVCSKKIVFGINNLLSWGVQIMDTDSHLIKNYNGDVLNKPKSILFMDNVWIGSKVSVLKGVSIPSGSVVAACSLVSGKFQKEDCIIAGNPAKVIKEQIRWEH